MRFIFAVVFLAGGLFSGLSAKAQNPEATVAFEMPVNVKSWQPDVFGQSGMYRFRQVHGACQITFVQNLGADRAKAAGRTPLDTIETYVRRLSAQVGEVTRSDAASLELRTNQGGPITFQAEDITYRGRDSVDYRNRIATQWVGAVELMIIAACPSSAWERQSDAVDAFIAKVTVHR